MTKPKPYSIRLGNTEEDRQIVLDLWATGFDHTEEVSGRYEWLYMNNPAGLGQVYFLDHKESGETVGSANLVPRRWKVGQQYIVAGIMADLVVDVRHRSLSPAIKLHNESINLGLSRFELIYGFPNPKSAVLAKFAKFQMTSQITRYARPLRYYKYLKKRMPSCLAKLSAFALDNLTSMWVRIRALKLRMQWRFKILNEFNESFDTLWESADLENYIIGQRDSRFLKWRFSQSAARSFKVFVIERKSDQSLGGYIVYYVDKKDLVVVADFFAQNFGECQQVLFLLFELQMRSLGYKSLSLNFYGPPELTNLIKRSGFIARESNPFSCKWTDKFVQLGQSSHWFITSADNDV